MASREWTLAAVDILTEVAGHYGQTITYADLAARIQDRSGVLSRSLTRSWVGGVLGQVVNQCQASGLPPLTSLVAHRADGGTDIDESTIAARLACYRRFADDVPAQVIAAALAQEAAAQQAHLEAQREATAAAQRRLARQSRSRSTTRTPPRTEKPPALCPTCFMQLPLSGRCDNCD